VCATSPAIYTVTNRLLMALVAPRTMLSNQAVPLIASIDVLHKQNNETITSYLPAHRYRLAAKWQRPESLAEIAAIPTIQLVVHTLILLVLQRMSTTISTSRGCMWLTRLGRPYRQWTSDPPEPVSKTSPPIHHADRQLRYLQHGINQHHRTSSTNYYHHRRTSTCHYAPEEKEREQRTTQDPSRSRRHRRQCPMMPLLRRPLSMVRRRQCGPSPCVVRLQTSNQSPNQSRAFQHRVTTTTTYGAIGKEAGCGKLFRCCSISSSSSNCSDANLTPSTITCIVVGGSNRSSHSKQ
jgi:hypothetical protein